MYLPEASAWYGCRASISDSVDMLPQQIHALEQARNRRHAPTMHQLPVASAARSLAMTSISEPCTLRESPFASFSAVPIPPRPESNCCADTTKAGLTATGAPDPSNSSIKKLFIV